MWKVTKSVSCGVGAEVEGVDIVILVVVCSGVVWWCDLCSQTDMGFFWQGLTTHSRIGI